MRKLRKMFYIYLQATTIYGCRNDYNKRLAADAITTDRIYYGPEANDSPRHLAIIIAILLMECIYQGVVVTL